MPLIYSPRQYLSARTSIAMRPAEIVCVKTATEWMHNMGTSES